MRRFKFHSVRVLSIQVVLAVTALVGLAQEQKKAQDAAPQEPADVLRINTELVQTDVMVFDKKGRFVEGLQLEQFELQVNGKRQPIAFFESVRAGSEREAAQLRAARTGKSPQPVADAPSTSTSVRGRTVLFYIDDLHVSPGSISRVRKTLLNFIDNKLGENDQVAITSATGRIGFLQQLTDNKTVLRAAVDRITFAEAMGRDFEIPPMNEYAAMLLVERRDSLLFDYFVEQTMKSINVDQPIAAAIVERRAAAIVRNSAVTNKLTLVTLANLMQSLIKVPGRKLVFFISDGFVPNYAGSDITDTLHRATEAAAAAGVVIYSMDALGLATNPSLDASSGGGFDPKGILQSRLGSQLSAQQEPLHSVATATGGRALVNTNALNDSIDKGLNETSNYYLLAWRPDSADGRNPKSSKIKVSIAGRPDLEVKVRRGYLGRPTQPIKSKGKVSESDDEILAGNVIAGSDVATMRAEELATSLFVGYKRSGSNTAQLVAFIEVGESNPDASETSQTSEGQVVGVVFDSKGKPVGSFRRGISIPKTKGSYAGSNYEKNLPEGLYQVRVFARERKSGRLGFAHQWIEIPDFKTEQLSMSSVYLGEITDVRSSANESRNVSTRASRRFARASSLRFTTYIYDSVPFQTIPELSVQTRILHSGEPITTAEAKVPVAGLTGFATIPYSAQFSLNKLSVGRYRLEVKVTDQTTKSSTTQQADFIVY